MKSLKLNKEKKIELVTEQKASNLTQKKWCEQNNISFYSFKNWVKLYREQKKSESSCQWIKAVPKKVSPKAAQIGIIKITTGNFAIEIQNNFDEVVLSKILKVIKNYD